MDLASFPTEFQQGIKMKEESLRTVVGKGAAGRRSWKETGRGLHALDSPKPNMATVAHTLQHLSFVPLALLVLATQSSHPFLLSH